MEKFAKFASLGALGVAAGTVALFPFLVWAFSPTVTGGAPGARGGIDHVGWYVLMVAITVPIAILAGAHLAFARQLKTGPTSLS